MTTSEITLASRPVAAPGRIGQATAVEQSRAVAEVYAAVMIAREAPRDIQAAIRAMEQACQTPEVALKAFYEVPRGGKTATDVSVHLARELATCWGNIQSHVAELRRDDEYGQSEMQAVAWDLETNNRVANTFIQPHRRAGKNSELLVDTQAIYETNANAGARRLRQCILAVLPAWYVERAKALCRKTANDGGGKPLPQRISEALKLFDAFNVTEDDIARRLGRPADRWTHADLGRLVITYESLSQGTLSRDEAFPPESIGDPGDIAPVAAAQPATAQQKPAPAPAEPVSDQDEASAAETAQASAEDSQEQPPPQRADPALVKKVREQLTKIGVSTAAEQLHVLRTIVGRDLPNSASLTTAEGQAIAERLVRIGHADHPGNALDQYLAELQESRAAGA